MWKIDICIKVVLICPTNMLVYLWMSAPPKHRRELLPLCIFFYDWYWVTPINLPRAFMPLFKIFEGKSMGLGFRGVQTIIYNHSGQIYVGRRTGTRASKWLFDIGSAGMVIKGKTLEQTRNDELMEEMGLPQGKESRLVTICYPYQGYSCIIYLYELVVSNDTNMTSIDGTYDLITARDHLDENISTKKDAKLMIENGLIRGAFLSPP